MEIECSIHGVPAMTLTQQQVSDFSDACKPLMKWLNTLGNPHVKAIVDCDSAEVSELSARIVNSEFILD